MHLLERCNLIGVNEDTAILDPGRELLEHLFVGVCRHAGVVAIVPAMKTADEVFSDDAAIGEQRAAMETAAVQHRHGAVVTDDHKIGVAYQGAGGGAIFELGQFCNTSWSHDADSARRPGSL